MKRVFIPIVCLFLVSILPRMAKADITSNLQGWWKMDEGSGTNVSDSSGNGYTGTFNYSGSNAIWITGKIGSHALTNGIGATHAMVDIGDQANLKISGNLTVSVWFRFSTSQSNSVMVGRWGVNSSYGMFVDFVTANHIKFSINDGVTQYAAASANAYNDGNWHLATGVYDGAHVLLYIDGGNTESVTGSAFSGSISTAVQGVSLGDYYNGGGVYKGDFDDARIYNRALTATDVKQLYQYPTKNKIDTSLIGPSTLYTGLIGWWTMDGKNTITNIGDSSGNANNGNLVGATTTVAGKIGQALKFASASSQCAKIPINLSSVNSFLTVSLWLNWSNYANDDHLAMEYTTNTNTGNGFFIDPNDSSDGGGLAAVSESSGSGSFLNRAAFPRPSANTWHLWTVVFNRNAANLTFGETVYIDGVLQTLSIGRQDAISGAFDNANLYLMSRACSTLLADGEMDDVRVYNRQLSVQEIRKLYKVGINTTDVSLTGPAGLNSGLIGWWTFDGKNTINNIADSSGAGLNGIMVGATTTTAGKIGQALVFNATNNYVDLGTASKSIINGLNKFSVSFWIKNSSTAREAIFGTYNGIGSNYWSIDFNRGATSPTTNNIRPVFRDSAAGNELSYYMTSTNSKVTDGKWHHYVVVWDLTGDTITLYIDGVSQPMTLDLNHLPVASTGFTNNIWLGELNNVGADTSIGLKGYMDDVRIYNRALSAAEVYKLYKLVR